MAKFSGKIGFAFPAEEVSPGVYEEPVVERSYYGDVIRNGRGLEKGEGANMDLTVGNSISIVADAYANENFFALRYVQWMGVLWSIPNIDVQHPRLILRLGKKYDGPTP